MEYITYENLCRDIRRNLSKIPRDVSGVIGIPRSGMLPATIIAEHLNVGLASVTDAVAGSLNLALETHGHRELRFNGSRKLLVVDDTCYKGRSLASAKGKLHELEKLGYELIYLCVYLEGPADVAAPDIFLRNIRDKAQSWKPEFVLYEWNLFAHTWLTGRTLFDLDGVLCLDPPDERDQDAYEAYIQNPVPLHIPTADRVGVCTYRLPKYANETLAFLNNAGIFCSSLYMGPWATMEERAAQLPWEWKAAVFKDPQWLLFVESEDKQARKIFELTGKPVICIETNRAYA